MAYVLQIKSPSGAWHDYTMVVKAKGFGWKRNDLDTEKSVRVKNGRMRRDKITNKRTCEYDVMQTADKELLARLDDDLSQTEFTARYSDLHGKRESDFYCTSFEATLASVGEDGTEKWEGKPFTMIEV